MAGAAGPDLKVGDRVRFKDVEGVHSSVRGKEGTVTRVYDFEGAPTAEVRFYSDWLGHEVITPGRADWLELLEAE